MYILKKKFFCQGSLKTWYGTTDHQETGYLSEYDKATETAHAGYYSVILTKYNVRTELTGAVRSGLYRFTFPEHQQSRIQIDLARRVGGMSLNQSVRGFVLLGFCFKSSFFRSC
jgi:putative alpha-1,2-mannosidase